MGKFWFASTILLVTVTLIRSQNCSNDCRNMLGCTRPVTDTQISNLMSNDDAWASRQARIDQAFTSAGCDTPKWDAPLLSDLPNVIQKIFNKVKQTFEEAPPELRQCIRDHLKVSIMTKLRPCFDQQGIPADFTLPEETDVVVFEPLTFPEKDQEYLLKYFTLKFNYEHARRVCGEAGTSTDSIAGVMTQVETEIDYHSLVCQGRTSCAGSVSPGCTGNWEQVRGSLCVCAQQMVSNIKAQTDVLKTSEDLDIDQLIRSFGQGDSIADLATMVKTCYDDLSIPMDHEMQQLAKMATQNTNRPGGVFSRLRIRGDSAKQVMGDIEDFLNAFTSNIPTVCQVC